MSRRGVILFALMCVIWGMPYLLIKVAVRDVSPVALVFARTTIGALVLIPVAVLRGEIRPLLARWKPIVGYTVVEIGLPWVLLSTAEKRLSSSLTGMLIATVPLVGVVIGRERIDRRVLVGLITGLLGVAALLGLSVGHPPALSVAMVIFVAVGYASGPRIIDRTLSDLPALGVVAASLVLCALAYAPFAVVALPSNVGGRAALSLVVLGVVCTAAGFVLFFALIAEVGPLRSTVITYVNPAVALTLGVAFLHEGLGVGTVIGFGLILAGCFVSTRARAVPVPEP